MYTESLLLMWPDLPWRPWSDGDSQTGSRAVFVSERSSHLRSYPPPARLGEPQAEATWTLELSSNSITHSEYHLAL